MAEILVKATLAWITDRHAKLEDGDAWGRVLVADPMNDRVRVVPVECAPHFPGWFPLNGIDPRTGVVQ